MMSDIKLRIFGHRGAAGLVFENTLESIRKAIELGVDYIEIDIWKTTDNELVVFHDFSLHRLTNLNANIADTTYAALQYIHLNNGATIPTLAEVVALVKPSGIPLLAEVKAENAITETLHLLDKELPCSGFIIGSFYHQPIRDLKNARPEIQTAIMFEGVPYHLEKYLLKVNPDYVVVSIETVNAYLAETVAQQQRKLVFYTVNTEAEFERAKLFFPYGIVTNFPDRYLPAGVKS